MDTGDSRLKPSPLPESLISNYRLFPVKVKLDARQPVECKGSFRNHHNTQAKKARPRHG